MLRMIELNEDIRLLSGNVVVQDRFELFTGSKTALNRYLRTQNERVR